MAIRSSYSNRTTRSMMDFINASIDAEQNNTLTYEEWCHIRNHGTPEEIREAVERMETAGGYDNLA